MSYENTSCPCGDKKPTDTMLCDACLTSFAGRRELTDMRDSTMPVEWRRNAAIILLQLARSRNRKMSTVFS
jgi:hypothetical protein